MRMCDRVVLLEFGRVSVWAFTFLGLCARVPYVFYCLPLRVCACIFVRFSACERCTVGVMHSYRIWTVYSTGDVQRILGADVPHFA